MGGGANLGTLLGLGNVDCTSWLRIDTDFNCWYHVPIVSAVTLCQVDHDKCYMYLEKETGAITGQGDVF